MRRIILLLLCVNCILQLQAQNPATVFTIPNRIINQPCGSTSCVSINAQVPHIKQPTSYVITNPAYVPFAYTTPTGIDVPPLTNQTAGSFDDRWTQKIPITFPFCYYGITYPTLVIGTNSAISFDSTIALTGSGYVIDDVTGAIPNTAYAKAMIFGPYHDIDYDEDGSTNKRIEYRIEGVSPKRRFIVSYFNVPYFGTNCNTQFATHMMVLYEATGIVEVYIHDSPPCTQWNDGMAILGMQNEARNLATAAVGKNATVWGNTNMDSCWRFIPSGSTSRFVSAGVYVNGSFVAAADTSTAAPGVLNLNWPNLCPTADSTAYELRVRYAQCTGGDPVEFRDTVYVKRQSAVTFTVAKTDATCSVNGTITVTATGATPPYEYTINGGTNWQASNSFTNVTPGTYSVGARKVGTTCPITYQQVTIVTNNTLAMTVSSVNATCTGGSITINATGGNQPYQYSINGGQTYQSGNTFTGVAGGTYNVTVRDAQGCTRSQSVTLTFTNNLTLSASQTANICGGQSFTPTFTSNGATYSWSPTTGVSNTQVLNPVLTPAQTTTYTVTATLGSCTLQRTVTVNVTPGASANAGPDASIVAGDSYTMQATASPGSYNWVNLQNPTTSISTILNPTVTPATTTTYRLTVTTGQGCTASDDVVITVIPYCIKPMEAFTPNGDGINDLWLITNGNCLTSAKAQVFNRYGSKVFESKDYKNNWNGTYEGKPLPDGTYYYVISFQLLNGRMVYLKGNLTILR